MNYIVCAAQKSMVFEPFLSEIGFGFCTLFLLSYQLGYVV